jgi:hypothetical protein
VPGHRPASPVGGLTRRRGAGQRDHVVDRGVAERRLAGLARGIAQQPLDASRYEALLPAPYRGPADPGVLGDASDRQPLGRAQDDPRPCHMLLGAVAIGHDRLQTSTVLSRDQRTYYLSHEPSIAHPSAFVNPLFASVR